MNDRVLEDDTVVKTVYDEPVEDFPKFASIRKISSSANPKDPQHWMNLSGEIIGFGQMWKHTLPKVGEQFMVYANKLSPLAWTSIVQKILSIEQNNIRIETENSIYEISWNDNLNKNENN